jgi:hypothetical protein
LVFLERAHGSADRLDARLSLKRGCGGFSAFAPLFLREVDR